MSLDAAAEGGFVRLCSSQDKSATFEIKKEYVLISNFLKTALEQGM